MTVNSAVSIFAGFMITLTLALAHFTGQIDMSHVGWLWFTAFVGANLFQMGFTGFCPAAKIFKALGLKDSGGSACAS
ncbi:MAG: DUF2892 domain-containing protein [Rubrivivax sp.]|nr:DUF2892 domain-containing protein [Rubrivivax sp.]